nr:MAG TPA: hypothetical protein [Caudoviricetes sp.]
MADNIDDRFFSSIRGAGGQFRDSPAPTTFLVSI